MFDKGVWGKLDGIQRSCVNVNKQGYKYDAVVMGACPYDCGRACTQDCEYNCHGTCASAS